MNGQYIERIEIDGLWNGHKHICWDLQPGVNILSGVNGVGKSTILNRVIMHLLDIDETHENKTACTSSSSPTKPRVLTSKSFAPSTDLCFPTS